MWKNEETTVKVGKRDVRLPVTPFVHVHNPKKGKDRYEEIVRMYAALAVNQARTKKIVEPGDMMWKFPLDEPLAAGGVFFVSCGGRKGGVGDYDNYLKLALDACQGVVYVNDRQIKAAAPGGVVTVKGDAFEGSVIYFYAAGPFLAGLREVSLSVLESERYGQVPPFNR